jgi:DNA-binding NarL/FixJ family response regulator
MGTDVLIVDDNHQFLTSASVLLEREGMNVVGTASTPEDAVELLRQLRPDVVLIDLHFGSVSGLDVAARLTTGTTGTTAVVLISSESYDDVRELLIGSPVRGFVSKVDLSASAIESIVGST